MTTAPSLQAASKAERRRLVAIGLVRSPVTAIVLVAAYYLLPGDRHPNFHEGRDNLVICPPGPRVDLDAEARREAMAEPNAATT